MIVFWTIAVLMILLAFWFVLPALLQKPNEAEEVERREANVLVYKDQYRELDADLKNGLIGAEQYQQEKAELERRLLEDVGTKAGTPPTSKAMTNKFAYAVAAFIPIAAISFYLFVGSPNGITASPTTAAMPAGAPDQPGTMSQEEIAANVAKLANRLKQNPNDVQGWTMLARSYMMEERFSDAASAYEQLTKLNANDADAWADYAEALALANGQNLAGKPMDAINRALQINPKHQKALDLAGSAAYQDGDFQKAIDYWQKILTQLPAGSEDLQRITAQISKAKELAARKTSR